MAEHLASIFGACRHGDRCSRLHTKPSISPTLLLSNMYQRPDMITPGVDPQGQPLDPKKIQSHFEDFYEDLFEELSKYGDIQTLNICDNLADHMVGNVYIQFTEEDQAQTALQNLIGRSYEGRPIIADFSPVTDFREATCRQYDENVCNRGGYCNFMHLKKIGRELRRQLFRTSGRRRHEHSRSRSRSPRHHNYDERHGSGRRGDHPHHDRGRRRSGRSRSPGGRRRNRSPIRERESSAERRAKIEEWNREKEEAESGTNHHHNNNTTDDVSHGIVHNNGRSNADNGNLSGRENGNYDY